MLNQTILVGRITGIPEIEEINNKKIAKITLAIPRSFKNENGVYDTDFISCTLEGKVAENTCEFCQKGDIIGVKGRLESVNNRPEVIAGKVTFLSSNRE